jgi:hypothetical protein
MQPLIDCLDQSSLLGQKVHGPQAAVGKSPCPVGHLEAKVAGPEHGPSLGIPLPGPESSLDSLLALSQSLGYRLVHSKCLLAYSVLFCLQPRYTQVFKAFRAFS